MANIAGRVETCDTGDGIFTATVHDNQTPTNFFNVDVNGAFFTSFAYVGYRLTGAARFYLPKEYKIEQADIDRGTIIICLEKAPEEPKSDDPRLCPWSVISGIPVTPGSDRVTDSMVATLHRLRETLVGTRIGRQFVSDYEDERVAEAFTKALTNEPNLGLQALGIVVEALPLIRRLSGYEVSTRSDDIQVPDRLVERTSKFLTAAAGDNKLLAEPLARVREFVEASRCRTALECYQALDPGEHDDEK